MQAARSEILKVGKRWHARMRCTIVRDGVGMAKGRADGRAYELSTNEEAILMAVTHQGNLTDFSGLCKVKRG